MGQVITANRLADGIVVFFGPDGTWVELIGDARVYGSADETKGALGATKKDEDDNLVLDIYAVDVSDKSGAIVPVTLREAIRASGPTILPALGKPAQTNRG